MTFPFFLECIILLLLIILISIVIHFTKIIRELREEVIAYKITAEYCQKMYDDLKKNKE